MFVFLCSTILLLAFFLINTLLEKSSPKTQNLHPSPLLTKKSPKYVWFLEKFGDIEYILHKIYVRNFRFSWILIRLGRFLSWKDHYYIAPQRYQISKMKLPAAKNEQKCLPMWKYTIWLKISCMMYVGMFWELNFFNVNWQWAKKYGVFAFFEAFHHEKKIWKKYKYVKHIGILHNIYFFCRSRFVTTYRYWVFKF